MQREHIQRPPKPQVAAPGETGSVIVIVMMFAFVFLAMGLALFYLVMSTIQGTQLESKEVKAFNVSEAGIDYGMWALKTNWPHSSTDLAVIDEDAFRTDFSATHFRDPTRSPSSDFISIDIRDNSSSTYDPAAPAYDANGDGRVYVASEANVDDDRHRIIILAAQHTYNLNFPLIAMYVSQFDANGQGLDVSIDTDPQHTEPLPLVDDEGNRYVGAFYNSQVGKKGLDLGDNVEANPSDPGSFETWIGDVRMDMFKEIATGGNTYFTDPAAANTFLLSDDAPGKIVYLETTSVVEIGGSTQIGTRDNPVVLVIDAGEGNDVGLDFKGTADFYGIIVVRGNPFIRGTSSIYGAFICSGLITNQGTGSSPEINYNGNIIKKINEGFTVSVNIVPNTWEEYTTPKN